ncbi:aminotransferase [Mycolicibacterium sp. 018/SC-01/001]|uniref:aminotransferase n=1 Tax=Mycolicibacterium sp. 018/SC-01/001 TaxID=2592069 RepID=UPI00117F4EC2|nr:aminotransferase [Mycolicibacterium sp. 018/SC-01/001]TRW80326.1 aminotransferase [Mycolicibacterium sp. 018/SC-01/001]
MTEVFDFFTRTELPAPALGVDEVRRHLQETFGADGDLKELGSQQDQNFLVTDESTGAPIGVLKLTNPVFSEAEIDLQGLAADTVAAREPSLRIPRVVIGPHGEMSGWWDTSAGRLHARVLEFVGGTTLTGSRYLSPVTVARMGELAAAVSVALSDVTHPASNRVLQWDLRHADRVIATLLPDEPDRRIVELTSSVADAAWRHLAPVASRLPLQLGHFDLTDDNVIAPDAPCALPDAIIDFGDVAGSWAVNEIAITVSSLLHHDGLAPVDTLPAVTAFHDRRPLTEDEADALWPLVALRGVVLVLSGRQQVRIDEHNSYADAALDRELRILEQAASVPFPVMSTLIHEALDLAVGPGPVWTGAPVIAGLARATVLDAGTTAPLNDDGHWTDEAALHRAAHAALAAGAPAAVVPAWHPRLTGAPMRTPAAPATVPTALTVWLPEDAALDLPAGAQLDTTDDGVVISVAEHVVRLTGYAPAGPGLPARTPITMQHTRADVDPVPLLIDARYAGGWRRLAGDPAPLIGLPPAAAARRDDTLVRRQRVLAEVQEHYYADPPRIERGWKEYLADTDGRVYLDMVNNVASVGHAHPRVVEAAHRQMRLLNTNSRFNYGVIAEFAERVAATLPEELDTVFFVNSGSEATDLAIRIAMAATGRPDIVAMREAYHGWTYASDAVSTSIADNPNALATRPAWVHTVDAANGYRGIHRGVDAARYAPEAVAVIDALADAGTPAAGFICESYFGNAGGVALPDGYLDQVYAAVRRHGGLAIADEVQVGYGRLGQWFWGFQQQKVVPDVVAVAKSVGGGQPIGIVVTRRAVAARYRTQGYFFSSTGGSPVSSAIGLAILDVIESAGLQENARVVGAHLKSRLTALGESHPIVGTVHGSGLYLGLEFVRDRETLEPATEETAAICDRLLTLGVIMQPTGDYQNVLKIKPPLCVSRESADYFADCLDRVLTTGW